MLNVVNVTGKIQTREVIITKWCNKLVKNQTGSSFFYTTSSWVYIWKTSHGWFDWSTCHCHAMVIYKIHPKHFKFSVFYGV